MGGGALSSRSRTRRIRLSTWWAGVATLVVSVVLMTRALDPDAVGRAWAAAVASPRPALIVVAIYGSAFVLRASLWRATVPDLSFGHALAAIHLSLGGNHVLPFRLGEALRVTSVVRRAGITLASATASTVVLRAADILAVIGLGAAVGPTVVGDLIGRWTVVVVVLAGGLWLAGVWWLRRLDGAHALKIGRSVAIVVVGATVAWVLESAVVWQAATWAGIELSYTEAILVTAVTIAAQIVAIAPAGLGTYEAAATAALVALGADPSSALAAALAAHALKTAYALATGGVAVFLPRPGALGRVRLPHLPDPTPRPASSSSNPSGPVVLFLPAHDEEATVAHVIRRVPRRILDHEVACVVIDDGSRDGTAEVARRAGADVVQTAENRGLGAAVRRGLKEAVARDAVAVAFCDADGEYAPEELERLVAPILHGTADYVVGSRFTGDIERMLPQRRMGNLLLTRLLSFVARTKISDGQSGYRAFSPAAAARAEIVHDFNYAQVLTLDLLAKGFRYLEVPITYAWRKEGRSFVRLGRYLRHVVPAVHRELNA